MSRRKPYKNRLAEKREREEKTRAAMEVMRRHRREAVSAESVLDVLRMGGARFSRYAFGPTADAFDAQHGLPADDRAALIELAHACSKGTSLLDPKERPFSAGEPGRRNAYVWGLRNLAIWHQFWVRRPGEWRCRTKNVDRQFSSLARHLLATYDDVPILLDKYWFQEAAPVREQEWFAALGRGENIRRQEGLPIPLTRRMAHEFSRAPSNLSSNQAIRWAQIISLGGDARCCNAVMGTVLGENFQDEDFWTTVIRFFIANPMLDTYQYGPMIDYISHQKFAGAQREGPEGLVFIGPPEPGFSMKGRTVDGLIARMEEWHRVTGKASSKNDLTWPSCGVRGFEMHEGKGRNERTWRITEILSQSELRKEGKAMRHCVGSYGPSCKAGRSAIFSMTLTDSAGTNRAMTIEVQPMSRTIAQARARLNAPLQESAENRVLRAWARHAGLRLSAWL